ncbi:uncharacterized protein L201_002283 [Kwoniella dendrophila CBS 6074]|uniref:CCAAT-binding factor domain-containing protein n=1 Tax=Kwoniella dendrophila CBS 6074 TaxID=1295534 RepID=A0AAX4JRA7_9TREE
MVSSLPRTKAKSSTKTISSSSSSTTSTTSNPLKQITKLETALLNDIEEEYDPNPLLPLINLSRSQDPQIVHKAIWSLHRVFIKFISENKVGGLNGDLTQTQLANNSELGEEREVRAWVRERLLEYVEVLSGLMRDSEPALRSSSIPLLFSLLGPLSNSIQSSTPIIHIPYFKLILNSLFNPKPSLRGSKQRKSGQGWIIVESNQVEDDSDVLPQDVIKIVVDDFWAKYDDIRWAFFKESATFIQNQSQSSKLSDPSNLLSQLLPLTNLPKLPEDINAFYISTFNEPPSGMNKNKKSKKVNTKKGKNRYKGEIDELPEWMKEYESENSDQSDLDDDDDNNNNVNGGKGGGGKRKKISSTRQRTSQLSIHQNIYSISSHTTYYTNLWENVLSYLQINDGFIRKILIGLHGEKGILGHFKPERRLRIADWLSTLTDKGGSNAMLAINGLFILMTQYNFEYPHFYDRLYGLLDKNVMHVKYRARFFRLLDTFLASSLLSSTLIASFIKRLSRLSLTSPPAGVILILPFIYNLFKRHPGTMILIQRPDDGDDILKISSTLGKQGFNDPFNNEEKKVLKTNAINSSLWEISSLEKHYLSSISTIAKIFKEPFTKPPFNLEDFLDHGYSTLFDTESNRKIRNPPALSMSIETATVESMPKLFPSHQKQKEDQNENESVVQGDIVSQLWVF